MLSCDQITVKVAARSSPLSKVQVQEVLNEIKTFYPFLTLQCEFLETAGDLDLKTSLKTLGSTDFFTREIDQKILNDEVDIGIHSAKDLPDPLPQGIMLIALTKGIDSSDSLVMRKTDSFFSLPPGSKIATSSIKREEVIKTLRSDLEFVDIRGKIDDRLEKLTSKKVDGVIIAEAALIRLQLTHLNRIKLPGNTTPGQGQLAITAKINNQTVADLFSVIDSRNLID